MQTTKPIITGNWREKHERLKVPLIDNEQVEEIENRARKIYRIGMTIIFTAAAAILIAGLYLATRI